MPPFERLIWEIGEVGTRLAHLGALEGAAGNISVYVPADAGTGPLPTSFDEALPWAPPAAVALPRGTLLITGTGRRLRDAALDPPSVLCAIEIGPDGWTLHRAAGSGLRPTSEIDTHLGIHAAMAIAGAEVRSVVHAQPLHLTWLSHIPAYQDAARLNRQLLRWQPETIVVAPEGIGILPFATPGTTEQGSQTSDLARRHRLVIWAQHGVVAHHAGGPLAAADLIEYAEAAARYEVLDIQAGRLAVGLSLEDLRAIARRFGVDPALLETLPNDLLR